MPIAALFDINLDGEDRGYEAANSEVLSIKLRDPSLASTVLFQVFDPAGVNPELGIAANPPRASKDAPALTLVGATSGPAVSPTSVSAAVAVTLPASGFHSYIIRCLVNGGLRALPNGSTVFDPSLLYERGVYIPTGLGLRMVVCTESQQFETEGWAGAINDLIVSNAGSPSLYTPPSSSAVPRSIVSRLSDEVHVEDFMTPAQIADANNGTKLYDMQPAIQAAIDWLLWNSPSAGYPRGRLRLPAGILRIDRTVQLNYGFAYRTLVFEGEGILRGGEHGQTGTCLFATFGDAPAIAVNSGLDVIIKQMAIVGINAAHCASVGNGAASMSHLQWEAWVDPALPASASSRYAPYAAIAIDPYSGPQPVVHYPDVDFPPEFSEIEYQYGKNPSGNVTVEDVRIDGFVVGVALQPADYDGNGDFVHLTRCSMWFCTFGLSWGNSQARSTSMTDCTFGFLHTVFTTTMHGKQIGNPQITLTACHFMTGIQVFEVMNLGYGIGPSFTGCFAEAMYRLGKCNGQSQNAGGITFRNCEFGFSWWARYGVPTWVLEMEGCMQVSFQSTFFYLSGAGRGFLNFRASGSSLLAEPARQLQFIDCQTQADALVGRYEKCAYNATLGLTVSLGSTCVDRFSVHTGYLHNLDTGTILGIGALLTEQVTAPRNVGAPVYAKKLKSLTNGNDPGLDVAWRISAHNVATVVSTVGRIVTITIAGITTASLMHSGGDVGDVFVSGATQGSAWVVKSRTGTQLTLEAMSGFDKDGALLTAVAPGLLIYAINCRRYALAAVLYGDITAGSPVVTNVILGNGGPPVLADIVTVDDYLYVESDVDQIINPSDGSARLASFDDGANTLTFAGGFFITDVRRRFLLFVRPAMPNA
jgi:hypothetical protein